MKRLFNEADGIRDELLNVHGVSVRDKDMTWATGGRNSRESGGRVSRESKRKS